MTAAGRTRPCSPHGQAAIEALMLVADLGGPTLFARIGMMRALNRHHVRSSIRSEKNRIGGGGNSRGTGCDLVHILDPKINDSLKLMVQINSNNEVGSCPLYSTSPTANTAVPASPKCGNNF